MFADLQIDPTGKGKRSVCCARGFALGRIYAGQVVTVHVTEHTLTIDLDGDDTRTIRRTTTQAVRSIKSPPAPQGQDHPCFLGHLSSMCWDRFVKHLVGLVRYPVRLSRWGLSCLVRLSR